MSSEVTIPWFEPCLDQADADAVKDIVEGGFVNEGPSTRKFESDMATYLGSQFAVAAPNCTVSIAMALMAVGVGPGDTVLVPDITFIGTAGAVKLAGAEPILVDIEPETFTMDIDDAARRLQPSTKAIVPVHLNGRSANMSAVRALADKNGLSIIEDAAEALGSKSSEGYLGTLADAGCFSLAPTKIITSGQGGFILTDKQEVRDNLVRIKDHGRLSRSSDLHPVPGYNFKFTDIQAGLAMSQFSKLDKRIARSLSIDSRYRAALANLECITFPPRPSNGGYLMWPDFIATERDRIVEHLLTNGIKARPFWPALHTQPAYASDDKFPGATTAMNTACWLPCSPSITDDQIDRVAETIISCFK